MKNGHNHGRNFEVPVFAGVGRDCHFADDCRYYRPAKGNLASSYPKFGASGLEGGRRPGLNGKGTFSNRVHEVGSSNANGDDAKALTRLFRMIFGQPPKKETHDQEIIDAYDRVSAALKGLDDDVLRLMHTVLIEGDQLS